eukprot:TRINITY_DN24392_c0_g1_i2.p1 TRINITY_DN24392_c0_g1~~TRINITY_DN24392_c0_g1_i2.p1  ORF type:complete len:876 (+),score=114.69 TRINITY_DN24392_c0_g1_i2:83-2710(+)
MTLHQGWLGTRGSLKGSGWQRRWCILSERTLSLYQAELEAVAAGNVCTEPSSIKSCHEISHETRVFTFTYAPRSLLPRHQYSIERPFGFLVDLVPSDGEGRERLYFDCGTSECLGEWMWHFEAMLSNVKACWRHASNAVAVALRCQTLDTIQGALWRGLSAGMGEEELKDVWHLFKPHTTRQENGEVDSKLLLKFVERGCAEAKSQVQVLKMELDQAIIERDNLQLCYSKALHRRHQIYDIAEYACMDFAGCVRHRADSNKLCPHTHQNEHSKRSAIAPTQTNVVDDLFHRGIALGQLLKFVHDNNLAGGGKRTRDIVRDIIIPRTMIDCSAMAALLPAVTCSCGEGKSRVCIPRGFKTPTTFFSHSWDNDFLDLVRCVTQYYAQTSELDFVYFTAQQLEETCWICIFAINHHFSICGTDAFPCKCKSPRRSWGSPNCEVDKFQQVLRRTSGHVVCAGSSLAILKRLWVLVEIWESATRGKRTTFIGDVGDQSDFAVSANLVCVSEARTGHAQDQRMLMQHIEKGPGIERFEAELQRTIGLELKHNALFRSAVAEDWAVVFRLLQEERTLIQSHDCTVLHILCGGEADLPDTAVQLLELRADPNARDGQVCEFAPIHFVALAGHVGIARALFETGNCDLGARALPGGETAASLASTGAAGVGHSPFGLQRIATQIVKRGKKKKDAEVQEKELVRRKAQLRLSRDLLSWKWPQHTAESDFFRAVARGDVLQILDMLEGDPNLSRTADWTYSGFTALHHVCEHRGNAELVLELVSRRADVNARSARASGGGTVGRWTPLHCAAYAGHSAAVCALLQLKADATLTDSAGFTARMWAERRHNYDAVLHTTGQSEFLVPSHPKSIKAGLATIGEDDYLAD